MCKGSLVNEPMSKMVGLMEQHQEMMLNYQFPTEKESEENFKKMCEKLSKR